MSDAAAWIEVLTSRGVTLQARGKNIAYSPKSAYSLLTNDERIFAKQHKAEIVAALRSQHGGTARPVDVTPSSVENADPAPVLAVPVVPCRWCYRSPCIGPEHPAFFDLHPEAQQRAAPTYSLKELYESNEGLICPDAPFTRTSSTEPDPTAEMRESLRRQRRGGDPNV